MDYSANGIIQITKSWLNFDGFVGVVCAECQAKSNVLHSAEGFWCGCGFYNRGDTGKAPLHERSSYGAPAKLANIVFENYEDITGKFYIGD